MQTALPMILAEELDADWSLVRSRHGSNDECLHRPALRHSPHRRFQFDQEQFYAVPRARRTRAGHVAQCRSRALEGGRGDAAHAGRHGAGPNGRKLGYGELAEAAMALPVPEKGHAKGPEGFPHHRPPDFASRRARQEQRATGFGIDVRLPGQLTAVVARPPVFGARLAVDDSAARAVKGVKAVLRVPLDGGAEGVAVVADGYWQATQGRDALQLQWDISAVEKVDSESNWPSTASWPRRGPARASSTPTWRRSTQRPGNWKRSLYFRISPTRRWSR